MSHPNAELIERFYTAFANLDSATMAACYHPQATFRDPAFELEGERIGAMWTMLCQRAKEFELTFGEVEADQDRGSANWRAQYIFSATKRRVDNRIRASFEFEDGLIRHHVDEFDFHRWARQALGPIGTLFGWSGWLQKKVHQQATEQLDRFLEKSAS